MRADESFAHEPDAASAGTGPSGWPPDEADERPEPYCDLCESNGHTFRTCMLRDDDPESF